MADGVAHLIKACDLLRLTYQIRLLTVFATREGLRLQIHVRPETRISDPLAAFVHQHQAIISIERAR